MIRTAIVAAMEDEILRLAIRWRDKVLVSGDRTFVCHEEGEVLAVAGGIGAREAERTARTIIQNYHPEVVISAGLAGALIRSLKVGSVLLPNVIVDAESGAEYRCVPQEDVLTGGVLVSAGEVAGLKFKEELVRRFHASAVDMEAAGVARAAQEAGVKFSCVKAISDEFDFPMPPLTRFIDMQGKMRTAQFVRWAAVRPQFWPATVRLARNSRRATQALGEWLRRNVAKLPVEPIVTLHKEEHW